VNFDEHPADSAESAEHGHDDFIFICPTYLECVLAAGDAGDIGRLRDWLAALPRKSYGRVFIEVDSPMQIQLLEAPPGVGITWIERKPSEASGAALMRAVEGWLDEWLRGDPLSGRYVHLWTGARDNFAVTEYWNRLETELSEIWAAAAEYRDQLA